ncbi:transposase [Streptomyces olivaceus]|uniref:transposase n=1 Tax=Streptomyces olivaceus TaxID=47716 RepID=UPI003B982EDB
MDGEWERLRSFLPVSNESCGRWRDHRQVIYGILHRLRAGVQWRDLAERFGRWKTFFERHRLWSADAPGSVCCSRSSPWPTRPVRSTGTSGGLHHRACAPACGRCSHRSAADPGSKGAGNPTPPVQRGNLHLPRP